MSFLLFHCVAGQQFIFIYYNSFSLLSYASVFSISVDSERGRESPLPRSDFEPRETLYKGCYYSYSILTRNTL